MNPDEPTGAGAALAHRREARRHLWIAIGWMYGATMGVVVIVLVVALRFEGRPLEALLEIAGAALVVWFATSSARLELLMRRAILDDGESED